MGATFLRSKSLADAEFLRTEFYNDYLRKLDLFEYSYFPLVKLRGTTAGLTLSRPRSHPRFSGEDERLMTVLLPHLRRAMEIYVSLAEAKNENHTILTASATMHHSVIVIDKSWKACFVSDGADKWLRAKEGLEIGLDGKLRVCSPNDKKKFAKLLEGIFEPRIVSIAGSAEAVQMSRKDGGPPFQVRVTPFSAHELLGVRTEPMAMIFVHDPEVRVEPQEPVLMQLYGLTKAEARLAAILADGKSLEESCQILGITDNTARTHLKHVFSKTGTHRQGELVKLIVSGLGNLRPISESPKR